MMKISGPLLLSLILIGCNPEMPEESEISPMDEAELSTRNSGANRIIVDNITELKNVKTPESIRKEVQVLGFYIPGDGGGGIFYWDQGSTEDENGATLVKSTNLNKGRWRRIYKDTLNVKWFGVKGDGVTNNSENFQKAINFSSVSRDILLIPQGEFALKQVYLKSNVVMTGAKGASIKSLNVEGIQNGGTFRYYLEKYDLENVEIKNLTFLGNRKEISPNEFDIFSVYVDNNRFIKNLKITDCTFFDAKQDFIRIIGQDISARALDIEISRNKFIGSKSTLKDYPKNGIRIYIAPRYNFNYGYVFAENIKVTENYGERIRSLVDLKRGCSNFFVAENETLNMHDCHISVDGSFNGEISRNKMRMENGFSPATGTNFIEIQGENIKVIENFGDGGGITKDGIFVTDYCTPEEKAANGKEKGHVSKNILIKNNIVKNITFNAFRLLNTHNSELNANYAENVENHPVAVSSGTGRYDAQGQKWLQALNNKITGNKFNNCGKGLFLEGENTFLGEGNKDEREQVDIYYGGIFRSIQSHSFRTLKWTEINPNPQMLLNPDTRRIRGWNTGDFVTPSTSRPDGFNNAVTLNDALISSLAEVNLTAKKIEVGKGGIVHFSIVLKKNTAPGFSVIIKEFNSSGSVLSTRFIPIINFEEEWTQYRSQYKPQSRECNYITFSLNPASTYNDPSSTGKTDIAYLNISRQPIDKLF